MKRTIVSLSAVLCVAATVPPSRPDLGIAEGRCRPGEQGPAVLIDVIGLKDRKGVLRAELYPPGDDDFLADDNILVGQGKTFRRVVAAIPQTGAVRLCVRTPGPGTYTLSLLHDRDGNRKFSFVTDGIGFSSNPHLGRAKPAAATVRFTAGARLTSIAIVMNYYHGLFSFGPLRRGS